MSAQTALSMPAPPPERWWPREGFNADVLGTFARLTLLNPTLTLPLALLGRYSDRGQNYAALFPRAARAITVLAALGTLRVLNGYFSRRALNNRVTDKTWDFRKEVVVVTGGSDGIGKRIVQMFAGRGVKVVVLDIQPLTWTPASGERVGWYKCDITRSESIKEAADKIKSEVGTVTVLINNAGICRGKPLLENTDSDLHLTFSINTIAHYKLAREFVPAMIAADHGCVVTIASSAAYATAPRMTDYAASKAAAVSFHEGLSAELVAVHKAPRVRTVLVNQGYTNTALFKGFGVSSKNFFGPMLHVDTVAEDVVRQVMKGESAVLVLPGLYKLALANFRSFPYGTQHQERVKMDALMKQWTGRQVKELDSLNGAPAAVA